MNSRTEGNGHPAFPEMAVWLEYGREKNDQAAHQLMLSLPIKRARSLKIESGFWLEFSPPGGGLAGWLRFEYVTALRQRSIFVAAQWRPASDPAPRPEDVLLGASWPLPVVRAEG